MDENRIRENLELFAFPRLSGTLYEKKAFNIAKEKIEEMNLNPEIQTFKFSTFYSRIYPKIGFPVMFWVFFTLYLNLSLLFVLISLFFTILLFLPFFIITRNPENIKIGTVLESQNLYVKLSPSTSEDLKSSQESEKTNIFFMAHLDSKGQRITARTRGLSILFWTISLFVNLIMLVLRLFLSSFYILFTFIGIIPMTISLITTVILSSNTTNNKSKGVVDNASGIACVLELLNYFSKKKNELRKYNLWFVLTGAEESGTMGIRSFYKILKDINPIKSVVHNFESLGKSINVVASKNNLKNNLEYYNFLINEVKKYNFKSFINPLPFGIHTDGIYLFQKNFNLIEYGSSEVGKFMHSEYDSLENVDISILKKLCEFILDTLEYFK